MQSIRAPASRNVASLVIARARPLPFLARPSALRVSSRGISDTRNENFLAGNYRTSLPWNTVIKFVPQQESWVVERFGKFARVLEPGLAILLPVVERIAHTHTLKERSVIVPAQSAITNDNVSLELDGVLYYRIVDPIKASYGVEHPHFAVSQLAQTTMRAEIGRLTLDRTLAERASLNANIVQAINEASGAWGIECLRYEVRDIHLPSSVVQAMHSQVSAERSKRAEILQSEGQRQAAINVAEGQKQSRILASEADKLTAINKAAGQAEAIRLQADATATSIQRIATAISEGDGAGKSGKDATSLQIAEKWVDAWGGIAKNAGSVVVVPSGMGDSASMVAQALSVFKSISDLPGKDQSQGPSKGELANANQHEASTAGWAQNVGPFSPQIMQGSDFPLVASATSNNNREILELNEEMARTFRT